MISNFLIHRIKFKKVLREIKKFNKDKDYYNSIYDYYKNYFTL